MRMILFSCEAFPTVEGVMAWLAAQLGAKAERLGTLCQKGAYCVASSRPDWMVRDLAEVQTGKPLSRLDIPALKAVELEQGVVGYE